jgi:hypothetical protein
MMNAAPQKEHQWLHKLLGEWTSEAEATMEPGKPPETFKGTESVRSLGDLWILAEGQGEMPGGGGLDAAERVLTLDAEGPDMAAEGKTAKYRDVIELKTDDHRVLTSHMLGDDGTWHQFMTAHYRWKK